LDGDTFVPGAVALGANLGNPRQTLAAALQPLNQALLGLGCRNLTPSRLYQSAPVGPPQPDYINAVLALDAPAHLDPRAVLAALLAVEHAFGRVRRERWGPRTLDLDLLFLGDARRQDQDLTLPHPRAQDRGFVLWPLLDAAPRAVLPGLGPVAALAAAVGKEGLTPITALGEPW
jgi:2-amino-4-hydroxy-6-hydroxymethyldihydropteridine diphosphokinase